MDAGSGDDELKWFFEKEFFGVLASEAEDGSNAAGGTTEEPKSEASPNLKRKIGDEEVIEIEDGDEGDGEAAEDEKEGEKEEDRPVPKGHYSCYQCHAVLPKAQFSQRQRKKKAKIRRKCKRCMNDALEERRMAALSAPVSAAVLYKNNKDRFIGS